MKANRIENGWGRWDRSSPRRKDSVDFGRYRSAASLVEAHDVWPEASKEDVSKMAANHKTLKS